MAFCFMKLRRISEDEGFEPDFPEVDGYLLLADCRSFEWKLYNYSLSEVTEDWKPERPASPALEALLYSAERYPPAMARMREHISRTFKTRRPTMEEFASEIELAIREQLERQPTAGYFMAPSCREEVGYLHEPEWYWLLGVSKNDSDRVLWVSDDYCIYANDIGDFKLSEVDRTRLQQMRGLS